MNIHSMNSCFQNIDFSDGQIKSQLLIIIFFFRFDYFLVLPDPGT